ncbi:YbdK family carboxylate-amine ligase [Solirubrobacter sp. CPCC 204708]|uniref:Putative glutamate--cysteine ligase 2 n=1 Tax=Solirubrobacter deserti TaxID=2282478 RepID=A0ABT4RVC4_9ACTN|nr:YbdK family carboxylate-amine ligase [Solirubrobacter deserti]MBE2316407.1 YbdK family carboxylate-amine ligase [Solirubrobacter deserti]MDA0142515.1 YbdK family carboxylate-amine ligase [Solirubrobacter deserti]
MDLNAARELFEGSQDLTVGIEEEWAIIDPRTLELVPKYEALRADGDEDEILRDAISGELISSEIEIRSGRGEDVQHALRLQHEARRRLFALADKHGVALASTGTHPLSDYRDQHIIDTEHYRRVQDGLQYVARRNNTFALQVHVGVNGPDRAIAACDRLRPVLPLLLAISANSPFVDGMDSGLHSARTQTFTKSFPRCGVPDPFGSWANWQDYVELLLRTNSIVEYTQLWWSVRAHHSYGTIEVRICDAQTTGPEADGLIELIVACVAQALREIDAGEVPPPVPGRLIEENMWRAIRYGQDGHLLDLEADRIEEFPAAEAVDRLRAWTGVDVALPELNGAQRQRRLIDGGASPYEVFKVCVDETRATYPSEEKIA